MLHKDIYCPCIASKTKTAYSIYARLSYVAYLTELVTGAYVGKMHLNRRNGYRLNSV